MQAKITITCDQFYTADFLRQLANEIEMSDSDDLNFETAHGIAEVTMED